MKQIAAPRTEAAPRGGAAGTGGASLRHKYAFLTAALVVGVVSCTVLLVTRSQRQILEKDAARRLAVLVEGASHLAEEAVASRDALMLYSHLLVLQKQHKELAFVSVTRGGTEQKVGQDGPGLLYMEKTVRAKVRGKGEEDLLLRFGFIRSVLDSELSAAVGPLLWRTLGIGVLFLLVGVLGSLYLAKLLSDPLVELAVAAEAVAKGEFDRLVIVRGKDEVGLLADQFNRMTGKVKELLNFREDVLHTLTHELNTPLSGLKGYIELWQEGKVNLDSKQRVEVLQIMMTAVARMEASLAGALLLFRAQERKRRPERAKLLWVNEILNETIGLFSAVAQSKRIELKPLGEEEIGCVYAEEDLLRQVITNILSNAVKYTPDGGEVRVGLKGSDDSLTFWVADTGPGIPAEALKNVFEKFDRSGAGQKSMRFGTGLGLSIVKKAVEAIGGRIWVESEAGKGAVFYVSIFKRPQAVPTAEVV
ncbi:MAG: HAMP domain-containing sensor histidine kinase [Elusimicrobiota bacterium]